MIYFFGMLATSAQTILPKKEAIVLQKMVSRRLAKSNAKSNRCGNQQSITAKELMLTAQCEKIEQLDAAHKSNQVYAQIKQATDRKQSACMTTCIEDKDGNIFMEQDNILGRRHEYIRELYHDNRGKIPQIHTENELTPVTRRELEFSL